MRLTCRLGGEHHITIPDHAELRIGTLAAILDEVAMHHRLSRTEVLRRLFG